MPKDKIKVIRVIARLNVGGPAIHVVLLNAGLDPKRYESILVSGVEAENEGNMLHLAGEKNVTPIIIPNLGRELSPFNDLKTLWQLYRLFRHEKPDIVHTHTAKAGFVGRIAAVLARVPIIVHTFHGHVLYGYFGFFKTHFFRWAERVLALCSTQIIAVSEQCRHDLLEYKIGGEEKIITIPLGLELRKFADQSAEVREPIRNEYGVPHDAFVVGMFARMVPIKRHEVLFHAIKIVLEQYPDTYFMMVGDGELRRNLELLVNELNITHRMIFCGFRQDQERMFQAVDAVVLTSRNEGLPVVIIEALSSGKPVIATRVGGVPELIKDGVSGYIVEPEDPNSIAQGLIKAVSEPDQTRLMGKVAQEQTLNAFDSQRLIRDMDQLYQRLMKTDKV